MDNVNLNEIGLSELSHEEKNESNGGFLILGAIVFVSAFFVLGLIHGYEQQDNHASN